MEIMQAGTTAIATIFAPVIQNAAGVVDLSRGATRVSGRSAASAKNGMSTLAADMA